MLGGLKRNVLRNGVRHIFSKLTYTFKTHKSPGEVISRISHPSVCSPLQPLLKYLSNRIRQITGHLTHLVRDSQHLVDILKHVHIPDTYHSKMVECDFKDFP